jgi:reversibly glycosylated polypeptide/UDP-arabinopyranose mutase
MGKYASCLTNFNGGIRNLGFAYIARHMPKVETIITLDDDTLPIGDPIQDHLDALNQRVPISWMSTASEYMRGFPYGVRDEAEVVLSHGVWEGVADWDAPTQLVKGSHRPVDFPKCPIPKGIYFPMCIMNVGFKRKMLPWMFQAPPAPDMNIGRSDDIYCGILAKREIDKQGWAAVTGYARVRHERASDVYKNLNVEAKTIELMESFWKGDESHPYFKLYREKLKTWQSFLTSL